MEEKKLEEREKKAKLAQQKDHKMLQYEHEQVDIGNFDSIKPKAKQNGFWNDLWSVVLDSPLWMKCILISSLLLMIASFVFIATLYANGQLTIKSDNRSSSQQDSQNAQLQESSVRGGTPIAVKDPF